jgi:hypothetical protein
MKNEKRNKRNEESSKRETKERIGKDIERRKNENGMNG